MNSTHCGRSKLAREAKAIVALAFRNGPVEDLHAGKPCPTCRGHTEYSHVTDEEMHVMMPDAVDNVIRLLVLRSENPPEYERQVQFGERYTLGWDDPTPICIVRPTTLWTVLWPSFRNRQPANWIVAVYLDRFSGDFMESRCALVTSHYIPQLPNR